MIVVAGTTAEVAMIIVDVTTAEVVMIEEEETIAVIILTMIGIVLSVIIPTLHSELNVIAVVSLKEEEAQINVMTAEVAMTDVDVTTAEVVMIEEAETIAATIQTMTGSVANARTQISHSELNVTAVVSPKESVAQILESGKVMTADLAIEEKNLSQELVIGIALNVENQISLRETSVSVVDARKE